MDIEQITQQLNNRFAAPLKEYYQRRIIFWYDEKGEFADSIGEISLENARIATLTGSNNFAIKKLLNVDDTTSNFLIYCPLPKPKAKDDWLLDIQLYSEEFHADLLYIVLREMGLPATAEIRHAAQGYSKYFKAKDRRKKIADMVREINPSANGQIRSQDLQLIILAVMCKCKSPLPEKIILSVLQQGLCEESNAIYSDMENYEATATFWRMGGHFTDYKPMDPSLEGLATHLLLNALSRTLPQECFRGLDDYLTTTHQAYCYDLVAEWMQSSDADTLYVVTNHVDQMLHLQERFMKLPLQDLYQGSIFPTLNEVILLKLMQDAANHNVNVPLVKQIVEKRRNSFWYEKYAAYYEGLLQVALLQEFYQQHAAGFHTVEPAKLWQQYTEDYYRMDTYYRRFQNCYATVRYDNHADLQDAFKGVMDFVENLYNNWFLSSLAENWTKACAEQLEKYGCLSGVAQQEQFYANKIAPDHKAVVIISDALRYEVAAQLAKELQREMQGQVELGSMQAILPSITKFGMASLLPHNQLQAQIKNTTKTNRLAVLADGMSTESNNRDKVLKAAYPASVALRYSDLQDKKRAERQELIRGMDIIYIYHDRIDSASHSDENTVFSACDDALQDIKTMVRMAVNEFNRTRILITADHGFLYTRSALQENAKVDKTRDDALDVEYGRRYAIMQGEAQVENLLPVRFLGGNSDFALYVPKENIRIKMQGAGLNYVHGGISPQEMVVPLVEYHHLRNQNREYLRNQAKYDTKPVALKVLTTSDTIRNLVFDMKFYQPEAVGMTRSAASFELYFVDADGYTVSDVQKLLADKDGAELPQRSFKCRFSLKARAYKNTELYYLVIKRVDDGDMQRIAFHIDLPFAAGDDFF